MKKNTFIISALLLSVVGFAQTGIGVSLPHPSAALEVFAEDKGVLLPRVQLTSETDTTTIVTGNEVSLLVYNTGSEKTENQEGLPKGFYYWSGDRWLKIINTQDSEGLVKGNETLTTLEVRKERNSIPEDDFLARKDDINLVYNDEKGELTSIKINDLVKNTETITRLSYNTSEHTLTYVDEQGLVSDFPLRDLVGDTQTLTSLTFNLNDLELLYKDELGQTNYVELRELVRSAWHDSEKHKPSAVNGENIYTNGWVGIGFTTPSGAPEEKLRVNGSITAVNSYYADYVFEKYFDGYSSLKYDYDFKNLATVKEYIRENRHLPGITPIDELMKIEEGYSFNVSELSIQLLEKTEELYLHVIEQDTALKDKEKRIESLEKANRELFEKITAIEESFLQKNATTEPNK